MDVKKTLTKVRRHFLRREPDENQPFAEDPPAESADIDLKKNNEEKLCFEATKLDNFKATHFQSLFESTRDPIVVDLSATKELSLKLGLFPNNSTISAEHLEIESQITPNSEFAAWARQITKIYKDYPKKMVQYQELVRSDNTNANASIRKMKLRSALASKQIEKTHPYRKMLFLIKKESMTFISSSTNEGFLKDLGYSFQSWSSWKTDEGASLFAEVDSSANFSTSCRFLESALMNMDAVQQGQEYNVCVVDDKGSSEKTIAQDVHVFEPVAEGIFVSIYFILKERALVNNHQKRLSNLDNIEDEPVKMINKGDMLKSLDANKTG